MDQGYSLSCENISITYVLSGELPEGLDGDHCHDRYEISYLISASGRYIVEGCEHKLSQGSLLLISPTSYHRVELDSGELEGYTIHFGKRALTPTVQSMLDKLCDGEGGVVFSPSLLSDAITAAHDRFAIASSLSGVEAREYMQAVLSEIIILLSATSGERMKGAGEELGARVAKYLNSNIERNISLERLARRFFVSKFHLCRAFKSYSGTSVHAYVTHKRIIHAKQLIESGMTASLAAERVGFGDYSAFYRAYVRVVGRAPSAQ